MHRTALRAVVAGLLAATLVAGCATSNPVAKQTASTTPNSSSGMSGMQMPAGVSNSVPEVNGIKPVASQVLATNDWQGMEIQVRTMTPTAFMIPTSSGHWKEVKPTKKTSFHLMVMLDDAHTHWPIPYATVWATISKGSFSLTTRQWPMLSAYMGPHYGNNVALPGPGTYRLSLLISPPEAARHLEYKDVWLKPHRVTDTFTWNGHS